MTQCLTGVPVPSGKAAVGWRVAVYWPEDSTLHDGEIIGFDNVTLRHHVRYDGGDQEHVLLEAVKVSFFLGLLHATGVRSALMPACLDSMRVLCGSLCQPAVWHANMATARAILQAKANRGYPGIGLYQPA